MAVIDFRGSERRIVLDLSRRGCDGDGLPCGGLHGDLVAVEIVARCNSPVELQSAFGRATGCQGKYLIRGRRIAGPRRNRPAYEKCEQKKNDPMQTNPWHGDA